MASKKQRRKSKKAYAEAKAYKEAAERELEKLNKARELLKEAEEEEKQLLEKTDEEIQELCNERGMRIGMVVSSDVIKQLIDGLIKSEGKPIFVKATLEYYDEDDEDDS